MHQIVRHAKRFGGEISVPGDKSISHRALILGAIAEGDTKIANPSPGKDVASTAHCLRALGAKIEQRASHTIVYGRGLHGLQAPKETLNAENSGTTMRLLCGVLAGQNFSATITGDESLKKRPMKRIIEPLTLMGAKIFSKNGFAPLVIRGSKLKAIHYRMPVASSQVKACLLLAGLHASGMTTVIEPTPTRDHTERLLEHMGVKAVESRKAISVEGGTQPKARDSSIPGDISSAAFFIAAATLIEDAQLTIKGVGTNQRRTGFLDVLVEMGAKLSINNEREKSHEPRADLSINATKLRAIEVGGAQIPCLIDELPVLAIVATQAEGTTVIRDAQELRVKETDRIRATVENLKKMGALVEERADGMVIRGPCRLKGAKVSSYGDHRVAMAFSIAGLLAEGETLIEGAEWADISFPGFFELLEMLAR